MRRLRLMPTILVLITSVAAAVVVASALLGIAADDLFVSVDEAHGVTPQHSHTMYGRWLATQLTGNLADGDVVALRARADELAYRSDRSREFAAVPAVVGLLIALLSDTPSPGVTGRRRNSAPIANTTRNGTV